MSLDNILEKNTFFKDPTPPFQLFLKSFYGHPDEFSTLHYFIQQFFNTFSSFLSFNQPDFDRSVYTNHSLYKSSGISIINQDS
jgi:hypothetical protein